MFSPVYVAWQAGTSKRIVVPARQAGNRFLDSFKGLQIRAQYLKIFSHYVLYSVWYIKIQMNLSYKLSRVEQIFMHKRMIFCCKLFSSYFHMQSFLSIVRVIPSLLIISFLLILISINSIFFPLTCIRPFVHVGECLFQYDVCFFLTNLASILFIE